MFNGSWRPAWLAAGGDPLRAALGHLERAVIEVVWRGTPVTVRDVQGQLARPVAYTTVMTTLDRLFKKGFVQRVRRGQAFVYSAAHTREQLAGALAAGVLSGLLPRERAAARPFLSNLVDAVAAHDTRLLDELEGLVRQKRRDAAAGAGGRRPGGPRKQR